VDSNRTHVAVIGAGAIGGILASQAALCRHDVTVCVRTPFDELRIGGALGTGLVPAAIATDPSEVGPADWVFLATKTQDTAGAAGWLGAVAGPETVVVALQNGVNRHEHIQPLVGSAEVLPALVYVNGLLKRPGYIEHLAGDRLVVQAGATGDRLAQLLDGATVRVEQDEDFHTAAWLKMLGNLAASPITALTGQRLGVLADPGVAAVAKEIIAEAVAVGRADGAGLDAGAVDDVFGTFKHFGSDTATSMYQDRLAGRPLEYEHLTGYVVARGAEYGVPTPVNSVVLALLRGASARL
jgi:2-dehydropantoate 2-reductase